MSEPVRIRVTEAQLHAAADYLQRRWSEPDLTPLITELLSPKKAKKAAKRARRGARRG